MLLLLPLLSLLPLQRLRPLLVPVPVLALVTLMALRLVHGHPWRGSGASEGTPLAPVGAESERRLRFLLCPWDPSFHFR